MKIGIIHPSFEIFGGAEQTTLTILDALKNTSHQVTLYTTTNSITIPSNIETCVIKKKSFPIGWNLQRMLENKKIFEKAKNEELLFISSGNLTLPKTNRIVIIYCHSTFESELNNIQKQNTGFFRYYHNYIKKQQKKQLKLLKNNNVKIISNSHYTKEKIKEIFKKESKIIFPPVKIKSGNNKHGGKSGTITIARYSSEKNLGF